MLRERITTGALLFGLAFFFLGMGGVFLQAFVLLVYVLAAYEFGTFLKGNSPIDASRYAAVLSLLPIVFWLRGLPGLALAAVVASMFFFGREIFRFEKEVHAGFPADSLSHIFLGAGYVGVFGTMLFVETVILPSKALLYLLLVVAACDIGAYFGGRAIGGRKLAPRISPKKTVSGAVCGLLFSALVSFFFFHYSSGYRNWTYDTMLLSLSSGVLLAALAMLGDLAESLLKRMYDIKDSGTILPGHGGVLDRIDGLLFAAPALLLVGECFL